jgi:hypothetical protein
MAGGYRRREGWGAPEDRRWPRFGRRWRRGDALPAGRGRMDGGPATEVWKTTRLGWAG